MTKKILVLGFHGSSGSLQNRKNTFAGYVKKRIKESSKSIVFIEFFSFFRISTIVREIMEKHYDDFSGIMFIGKSVGATKIFDVLENVKIFNRVVDYQKRVIVTIDPHYPFGIYGPNKPIDFDLFSPLIPVFNIRQISKYPRGAVVKGALNETIHKSNVNHWNIVKQPETISVIEKGFQYVEIF